MSTYLAYRRIDLTQNPCLLLSKQYITDLILLYSYSLYKHCLSILYTMNGISLNGHACYNRQGPSTALTVFSRGINFVNFAIYVSFICNIYVIFDHVPLLCVQMCPQQQNLM